MTTLREAAQQALEALLTYEQYIQPLTNYFGGPRVPEEGSASAKVDAAITALRAALAQEQAEPVQEPVAWIVMDESGYVQHAASWRDAAHEHINDAINEHDLVCARTWRVVPAYTTPSQRKPEPLTEEEITQVLGNVRERLTGGVFLAFARAIERAHGIGGQDGR